MTEQEWLRITSPGTLLTFRVDRAGDRKLRLYAVACCRRIWHLLPEAARRAVEIAEGFADGTAPVKQFRAAAAAAARVLNETDPAKGFGVSRAEAAFTAVMHAARPHLNPWTVAECAADASGDLQTERAAQAELVRCIFGNPFHPTTLDPSWLTSNVLDLARTIYNERCFDRLPILADALMDAGCTSEELLAHCRSPGPHVRGCWAVDLLLGEG